MRLVRKIAGAGSPGSALTLGATQQESGDGLSGKEGVSFGNLKSINELRLETS